MGGIHERFNKGARGPNTLTYRATWSSRPAAGSMGTFALVLVPAWIAFRLAPNWCWTLIGVIGALVAFVAALRLDQPFGPMLVGVLLGLALLASLARAQP